MLLQFYLPVSKITGTIQETNNKQQCEIIQVFLKNIWLLCILKK